MIGRSGSPSRKSTITSWPIRGIWMEPQLLPAHDVATRTQQELSSFFLPLRSQWNCTFTRPCLSVQISSPDFPTTTAVWEPRTTGRWFVRGGRNGTVKGIATNELWYWEAPAAVDP